VNGIGLGAALRVSAGRTWGNAVSAVDKGVEGASLGLDSDHPANRVCARRVRLLLQVSTVERAAVGLAAARWPASHHLSGRTKLRATCPDPSPKRHLSGRLLDQVHRTHHPSEHLRPESETGRIDRLFLGCSRFGHARRRLPWGIRRKRVLRRRRERAGDGGRDFDGCGGASQLARLSALPRGVGSGHIDMGGTEVAGETRETAGGIGLTLGGAIVIAGIVVAIHLECPMGCDPRARRLGLLRRVRTRPVVLVDPRSLALVHKGTYWPLSSKGVPAE
jgi:hypothetical protein